MADASLSVGAYGDSVARVHEILRQHGFQLPASEVDRTYFGPATRQAVQQFQEQNGLPVSGEVDTQTARAMDASVAEISSVAGIASGAVSPLATNPVGIAQPGSPPTAGDGGAGTGAYTVVGTVASPDRPGVGGLRVQIVDKNVGQDILVAETGTDPLGQYHISFALKSLRERYKDRPDLQARVYAGPTFLAASDVRYNAANLETLNVLLPPNSSALPSEHETLTDVIATHYKGNLGDLQETADRSDITYLANKTGWDARAVALAALADQFSRRTDTRIPAVFFYALFRGGLPANEDVLYHTDAGTLTAVWSAAADQGVIPPSGKEMIPELVQQFQALSAQKLLSGPPIVGISNLKQMLTVSSLSDVQQQQFAELYAAHRTDLGTFWTSVADALGKDMADRLQADGKLALLTINNAPLMQSLHQLGDPLQLVQAGYHRAAKWGDLLTANAAIPSQIPGDTQEAKLANYAGYLAAQLRLSYPTAAVAEMVKSGDLRVDTPVQVEAFLTANQGNFEIGMQSVDQYIARNSLNVDPGTVRQLKSLQRVYQITPGDQAMSVLLNHGLDAAYHVALYDRQTFVETFGAEMGGIETAMKVHDKSIQISGAVLNVAISYLTARNGFQLGTTPVDSVAGNGIGGQVIQPAPKGPTADNAADVIAYPTLEGLFGSMDYCSCEECRSLLSPAAYLVDLLLFIDKAADGQENAQDVLFDRRPDIKYLPLTCENTNTAMPYIDLVNETLEYYIANTVQPLSLKNYQGHDTNGTASADLLASPQFAMDSAYTLLKAEWFPSPLPFHQPLENLRRYSDKFGVSLPMVMERLRPSEDLERGANAYGWRDILMEQLGLSRQEYQLLTDSTLTLKQIYGFDPARTDGEVVDTLSNTKMFARRIGVSYDDVVSILKTRFVNPNSDLIPKIERLGVPFTTMQALHDGTMTDADFLKLLPTGAGAPDPAEYGGDIAAWVKNAQNYARIMAIITLTGPTDSSGGCDFGQFELRYSQPVASLADTSTRLGTVEFIRLLRFIRLWIKTGWTIEQTDAAICALYRTDLAPVGPGDIDAPAKLDAGFLTLLPRLGIVARVMSALGLTPQRDLPALLACWSDISTHGDSALYRQMFLNPTLLKQDAAFADNGYGEFLVDATQKLLQHAEALRGAFNLTGDEFDRIVTALGYDGSTPLSLDNISAIYRRGWLARHLRVSVRELLLLSSLTGLDPFAAPDIAVQPPPPAASVPPEPPISQLIELVQALKARSLKSAVALYLIWNQDLSGKSAPAPEQVAQFARTLRSDFADIEGQFAATEDPGGDILRARMSLVYGQDTTDAFFALLDNTLVVDASYTHPTPTLEPGITGVDSSLTYDNFRHLLAHQGILGSVGRAALKAVPGVTPAFQAAVDALFARSQDALDSFFVRHPELKPLYDAYVASGDPPDKKRTALLAAFQPELARRRKREQALERMSAAAGLTLDTTRALLDPTVSAGAPYPLHAADHTDQPVLNDVLALEVPGLAAQFFYRDTATGAVDQSFRATGDLNYSAAGNPLPANPTPGAAISGIWTGWLEVPEAGYYNVVIDTDAGANVTLQLASQAQPLIRNGTIWRNSNPLQLNGGTLYDIVITVEKVTNALSVNWETPKQHRAVIPGRYLYPPSILPPFHDAYVRFLKVASLVTGLGLTANEIAHFAVDADYQIGGDGWLNVLPATGDPNAATAAALVKPFLAVLDFARIKADWSSGDEQVLSILQDPASATVDPDSLLFTLSRWDNESLTAVLTHFTATTADLTHFDLFRRTYDAFAPVQAMGISAGKLITATTNDPDAGTVRDFQAALRARYAAADWRDIVRPINDTMRELQRDALVAYILRQMQENPATAHVDTPDKLFEYFLMDVEMEACMETSRIRNALSSVQLFVDRCLMNLEPRVSPKSINAAYWTWKKRYRVWEANRKVFLFPENWLEPELRDDKSPFFKEIESELLQSDITDDSAAIAVLNYLAKLHDVAKLEPCGMFVDDRGGGDEDPVVHVVARSSGAHRTYYYRRYELGYWTPWEQIKLDIEDNPVIPVVWNGRLHLFWLRLLKQAPIDPTTQPTTSTATDPVANLHLADLKKDASTDAQAKGKVMVQATLCWSELYNGKWQTTKTSDIGQPLDLGEYPPIGDGAFVRSSITLSSDEIPDDSDSQLTFLRITIWGGLERGAFLLYNTHSLPIPYPPSSGLPYGMTRGFETEAATFTIDYVSRTPDIPDYLLPRDVLTDQPPYYGTIQPRHHVSDIWDAPFFFEDRRNVFYVTTQEQPTWVRDFGGYGVVFSPGAASSAQIPNLVMRPPAQPVPRPWAGPTGPDPGVIDPSPVQRLVTEDAYIRQGLGTTVEVAFGDRQIGPAGAVLDGAVNAERG